MVQKKHQALPRVTRGTNEVNNRVYEGTREEWLQDAARLMWPWVTAAMDHLEKPVKYQKRVFNSMTFTVSLMSGGFKHDGSIGHVQYKQSTGNKKHAIRISPILGGKTKPPVKDSVRVCDVVLHEMMHVVTPNSGHRGDFQRLYRLMGLGGKPTATVALKGSDLYKDIRNGVVGVIGLYPHGKVNLPAPRGKRGIGSRMLKITCSECDLIMRTSSKHAGRVHEQPCPACPADYGVDGFCGLLLVEGY